jgi:hypothetical protein
MDFLKRAEPASLARSSQELVFRPNFYDVFCIFSRMLSKIEPLKCFNVQKFQFQVLNLLEGGEGGGGGGEKEDSGVLKKLDL